MTWGSTKAQTPPAVSMTDEGAKELSGTPRQGHGGLTCEPDGETVEATATLCRTQEAVKRPGNRPRRAGIERGGIAGAVAMEPGEPEHGQEGTRCFGGRLSPTPLRPLVPLQNPHEDRSPRSMTTIVAG